VNATVLRAAEDPFWVDAVSALLWLATAILAVHVVRAHPRGARAAWVLVCGFGILVVLDKAFDLQLWALDFAKVVRDMLFSDPQVQQSLEFDLREHRSELKAAVLVAATVVGLGSVVWLVRTDRGMDRNRVLALLGVLGVIGYVGLRMVPGVEERVSQLVGWAIEFACWSCVTLGLALGLRKARKQ
jgi:hypothetical protein